MDYAYVAPEYIPASGTIRGKHVAAHIGFEVGRNKGLAGMGDLAASRDCRNAQPGDATKLIRELKFSEMRAAYLLEFYDSIESLEDARDVVQAVTNACGYLPAGKVLHLVVVVREEGGSAQSWIVRYPSDWLGDTQLGIPELPLSVPPALIVGNGTTFFEKCGPCSAALLQRLRSELRSSLRLGTQIHDCAAATRNPVDARDESTA